MFCFLLARDVLGPSSLPGDLATSVLVRVGEIYICQVSDQLFHPIKCSVRCPFNAGDDPGARTLKRLCRWCRPLSPASLPTASRIHISLNIRAERDVCLENILSQRVK